MAKRDYRTDPLHLWPPGALDDRHYTHTDMPNAGVFTSASVPGPFGDGEWLSLDAVFRDYQGTFLLWENANGLGGENGWEFNVQGFIAEGHPDLETLAWALASYVENHDRHRIPIVDLLDLCADFLHKKGWVEVCYLEEWAEPLTSLTENHDIIYWHRRDEWR